jgi:hypothetical protein
MKVIEQYYNIDLSHYFFIALADNERKMSRELMFPAQMKMKAQVQATKMATTTCSGMFIHCSVHSKGLCALVWPCGEFFYYFCDFSKVPVTKFFKTRLSPLIATTPGPNRHCKRQVPKL